MGQSALITGGAGFIGSHVADLFVAEGYDVTVVDNLASGRRAQVPAGAAFFEYDITAQDTARLVEDSGFDVICHLAAQIDVRKSVADPVFDARVNVGGSLGLLEAVRRSGKGTRVIFSSTGGAIYGDLAETPTAEDAPKNPQSPYGTAKLSVEYYLGYFSRVQGLDVVSLRYSNVYGPRQDPHGEAGVVAIFCGRILDGAPLTVFGDGEQTRDYVYVGDVARANVLAARADLPPVTTVDSRAFNIGTAMETSVLELAQMLRVVAGSDVPVRHGPPRLGEQRRSVVRVDRSAQWLRWRPEVDLRTGLGLTYRWFAEQRRGIVG
jgi:UDP-glucose 4-epimerase